MSHLVQNPPWVNRIITRNWDFIREAVPPEYVPFMHAKTGRRGAVKLEVGREYGCGHYGCVMRTEDPDTEVVVKVTSDPSEASFVDLAWKRVAPPASFDDERADWIEGLDAWPAGIVRYYQIVQLDGTYRGRPVWILWRDEAYHVGGVPWPPRARSYEDVEITRGRWRIQMYLAHASYIRRKLLERPGWTQQAVDLWQSRRFYDMAAALVLEGRVTYWVDFGPIQRLRGPQRVAAHLSAVEIIFELMANEPAFYKIGQAFETFLSEGILMADVHYGNIGCPMEERCMLQDWVITDPGHMVKLW